MPEPDGYVVPATEYENLLVFSVRYALPRQSAGASVVAQYVVKHAAALTETTRIQIAREIIDNDTGDRPTRPEWQHALKALEAAKGEPA